ncbi:TPA: oligoribonuclease [Candidatus Dependentiae bacterium]|nr:MAG: Oligoribonuclease [candidate division TM6 bacterium GW2011_GWF2_43_87]HBL98181.1 oligoribonuclease [Candidatus Dependentiae bacterium]
MGKKEGLSSYGLLWIDMEMTGLDSSRDVILEVAAVATDLQLKNIQEGPSLVVHQPEEKLALMDAWCQEHHAASGLVDSVRASKLTVEQAEDLLLAFVQEYCSHDRLLFAGNTVYQDRAFLARYMPRLNAKGHYRLVDVSSIKELVVVWYKNDPMAHFKKGKAHRALTDVYESIEELRHYRQNFFV